MQISSGRAGTGHRAQGRRGTMRATRGQDEPTADSDALFAEYLTLTQRSASSTTAASALAMASRSRYTRTIFGVELASGGVGAPW